jgi:hypothetical protein
MLSIAVDQKDYRSQNITPLDRNQPEHFWVFRNMDFEEWHSTDCSQVLWLSGPPSYNLDQVSSHILDYRNDRATDTGQTVLYFFLSSAVASARRPSNIDAVLIYSLLHQIVSSLIAEKKSPTSAIEVFIRTLLNQMPPSNPRWEDSSPDTVLRNILDGSAVTSEQLWNALKVVMVQDHKRKFLIAIDGLHITEREIICEIRSSIAYLQERIQLKALLTNQTRTDIKEALSGLPCIEYDKERQGWVASSMQLNQADMLNTQNALIPFTLITRVTPKYRKNICIP